MSELDKYYEGIKKPCIVTENANYQVYLAIWNETYKRFLIDYAEAITKAPCLVDEPGLFNETKLSNQSEYCLQTSGDFDCIECIETYKGGFNGLVTKCQAPRRIASTAVSTDP